MRTGYHRGVMRDTREFLGPKQYWESIGPIFPCLGMSGPR